MKSLTRRLWLRPRSYAEVMQAIGAGSIIIFGAHLRQGRQLAEAFEREWTRLSLPWPVRRWTHNDLWRLSQAGLSQHPVVVVGLLDDRLIAELQRHRPELQPWVISASAGCTDPRAWLVQVDAEQMARVAVEHLRGRGYQRIATWGRWRPQGHARLFAAVEAQALAQGCDVLRLQPSDTIKDPASSEQALAELLRCEVPVGMVTRQDQDARFVAKFCHLHGFSVPQSVGILGVDDDPEICNSTAPSLSSVRVPYALIGATMARLALHLCRGDRQQVHSQLVPPYGVSARDSTNRLASMVEDSLVAAFLRDLSRRSLRAFNLTTWARAHHTSPATLRRRVQAQTGLSPQDLLMEARVARACQLLRDSDAGLDGIAQRSGFASQQRLHSAFVKRLGVSPGRWRQT